MFTVNTETRTEYAPGDSILIKNIVTQLKSQGVFDQFRKECISDVDTKPAYQNLCHRVDGRVESFLSDTKWGPHLNKNQLRENLRKYVNESSFVDSGITRIVDQLVNPRINTVLVPKVEDIVYSYLGIQRTELNVPSDKNVKPEFNGPNTSAEASNVHKDSHVVVKTESGNKQQTDSVSNDVFTSLKNEIKEEPSIPPIHRSSVDACSNIDSDEDDISPPYEPHQKSDVELSPESDYSMDLSDMKYEAKSEPSATPKLDAEGDKIFQNLERICGDESMDSIGSSCTDKISSRKPSLTSDLPKTPSINYDTSDESQDNSSKKNGLHNVRRESVPDEANVPDTSAIDSLAEKIAQDNQESSNENSSSAKVNKEEKPKEREDPKHSESRSSDSKDSKHRDRKHSDHKRDKDRKHESSRSDRDHKNNKDKDRSSHDSKSRTSKEKSEHNRDRKEYHKESSRSESDKSKSHEKSSKERKDSTKSSSSSDRHRSSNDKNKSRDSKDGRKTKSSSSTSKHESDRSKHRREGSSDLKKSKTQCSTDEKKVRSDRRSSDRDSNGTSSASRSSSYRSSSKTDKEKHRHSSSSTSSSSHKSKKNTTEVKDSDRSEESLFNSLMSITGSVSTSSELSHTKTANIENANHLFDILNDEETKAPTKNTERRKSSSSTSRRASESSRDDASKNRQGKDVISSRKSSSLDGGTSSAETSDLETKKPKIAKNAADVVRIMEIRKQYKDKTKSSQQGKENANVEIKKDTSIDEHDPKSFLSERCFDNCTAKKNGDKAQELDEVVTDCRLKIMRIDAHYRLVNGSCVVMGAKGELSSNNNDIGVDDANENLLHSLVTKEKHLNQSAELQTRVNGALKDCVKLKVDILEMTRIKDEKKVQECDIGPKGFPPFEVASLFEEINEFRYFEPQPPHLYADFKNFVAKRIKEKELRLNLQGSTMMRKGRNPFKYNSELISSEVGNEKGIMMRIKKTETLNASLTGAGNCANSVGSAISESLNDLVKKKAPVKKKTLGIKRRLSNNSKVTADVAVKAAKLNHSSATNGELNAEDPYFVVMGSLPAENERVGVGFTADTSKQIANSCTSSNQKNIGTNIATSSTHSVGPPAPKVQRRISEESKRKQFYYDTGDLYKPRPSFLASSRRSRGLNPD